MKKYIVPIVLSLTLFLSLPAFSQTDKEPEPLGLPGDNLDLYAVLDLFQKSKTIEDFEKSLNKEKGINNLDLDLDKKVDFIKVVTKQNGSAFQFILQVAVSEKETQDVAVILVDKNKEGKVTLQIVGDKALYGPNYIVEPGKSSVTANPAYTGAEPVKESTPATTTTVVVEQVPVVQYVYSPAYVPYYPPYHYGYYPPYFAAATVIAVGIYRSNHYYHHHGGHYHNTTVIHNENNFNNYNNSRNTSNRVSHNASSGRYNEGNRDGNRQSGASSSNRPSAGTSDRQSGASSSNRPSAGTSDRQSGASSSNRPSAGTSDRSSGGASASNRASSSSMDAGRTRSSGGGNYGGGGGGGGMSRGGGGGGGGRRR